MDMMEGRTWEVVIVGWRDRERGVLMGSDSDGFLNVFLWESRCGWGLRLLFAIPSYFILFLQTQYVHSPR